MQLTDDLESAMGYLVDQMEAKNEAKRLGAGSVELIFPQSGEEQMKMMMMSSSYPDYLKTGILAPTVLGNALEAVTFDGKPNGRKKALLIGISYEHTIHSLSGTLEDSKRMKKLLTGVYGFTDSLRSLVQLTDVRKNRNTIFEPTKSNILAAMSWLVQDAIKGDVLFIHYSGHGAQMRARHGTLYESDGLDETILPSDFENKGIIRDDDIFDILCRHLPRGAKLVAMFDCCHSGTGLDLPYEFDSAKKEWRNCKCRAFPKADITLIAGCRSHQTSADLSVGTRHGTKCKKES